MAVNYELMYQLIKFKYGIDVFDKWEQGKHQIIDKQICDETNHYICKIDVGRVPSNDVDLFISNLMANPDTLIKYRTYELIPQPVINETWVTASNST